MLTDIGRVLAWRLDKSENKELVRLTFGDLVERHVFHEQKIVSILDIVVHHFTFITIRL